MRRISRPCKRRGFTLVEVMVALGITAGALILLLSANRNVLQRSMRARDRIQVERACESKLDEVLSGAETSMNGQFERLAGYAWSIQQETAELESVTKLQRVTFQVNGPSGLAFARTFLRYGVLQAPTKGPQP
jgi:type II secretion system protein I